ncbi:MAG: hypothetical protein BZ136_08710 [Methanosphaera sp. rholeuAM74]|nr:MAG: hypothetical protein BZ136_08710 [Methanosphaera sp. rholeuAM74]
MTFYDYIYNSGNLSLINCTLACAVNNTGSLIIDNSGIPGGTFSNYGELEINNVSWLDISGNNRPDGPWNNLVFYSGDAFIRNSSFSSITKDLSISVKSGNLYIYDCQFTDFSGTFTGASGNASITLINTTMKNNKRAIRAFDYIPSITMINCTFEDNNDVLSADNAVINNCTFINNSKVITSNNTYVNDSVFINHTADSILRIQADCTISNCTFENNSLSSPSGVVLLSGVAINLLPNGNNEMLIVDNVFKNNHIDTVEGITTAGYMPMDYTRNGYGTDISLGAYYRSNNFMGSNNHLVIANNQFINSQTTQKAGAIFINFNETCEDNSLEISANIFENVKSESETIIHNNTGNVLITDNNYVNCTIDITEFTLSSPVEDNIIAVGDEVALTINTALVNPEFYDANILDNYSIVVNDTVIESTTDNTYTFVPEDYGTLNIKVTTPVIEDESNIVVVYVNKYELTVNPILAEIDGNTDISVNALINDENIDSGRVYFTVNGKILRDQSTGKILYADVSDGVATLSDVNVTKAWNEDTEIVAVYQANNDVPSFTSDTVNPTITYPEATEPEFTVTDATATAGSEVTITVTTKNLGNGKVVLKVNGKTVKANDGKLYAKVTDDTTTFTYTVPKTLKSGGYTIKAVYTSGTSKLESEGVLTIE